MPTQVSYPGVYIEEIPSGVRTITGVATSITAFLGRTFRGTVDEPILISNFGNFEREFGGLHFDYPLTYAVKDFFLNGGSQALIVRLFKAPEGIEGRASLTGDGANLEAMTPGTWGNFLEAKKDTEGITETTFPDILKRYRLENKGLAVSDFFNLSITDKSSGRIERFLNLSAKPEAGVRYIETVLAQGSQLVRFKQSTSSGATGSSETGSGEAGGSPSGTTGTGGTTSPTGTEGTTSSTGASPDLGGKDSAALDQPAYLGGESDGFESKKKGLYALAKADLFNLLCIPPDTSEGDTDVAIYDAALSYCQKRRAMLIVDPPSGWKNSSDLVSDAQAKLSDLGLTGERARNGAIFYPRVMKADTTREGEVRSFVPCGLIAGIMARTDATRGVWKAPAGLDASLSGVHGLEVSLIDQENGTLNQLGINCLRSFPVNGRVVWGARTLRGADQLADEYKYIPVRRLVLFIEESLYRGTQWAVFEPNDEPLWSQLRLNIGAFMNGLFRQGAFQGRTPQEAYFVKCDQETTTQNEINLGIVNAVVGFAPLKPAEFVVIKIQQIAGQIAV
ncbi:MAG: phage tail protein [Phormidesmis priestleyi]|uniref:Phage tail protein n=1 Tax=Phormidesmis priestleyi TaxID=268141 RepID=A0A2W4X5P0_9CYAN|nr:MAG: phage tail protein [Phormidesmis priestleyi]